jgi:hypothetical protein
VLEGVAGWGYGKSAEVLLQKTRGGLSKNCFVIFMELVQFGVLPMFTEASIVLLLFLMNFSINKITFHAPAVLEPILRHTTHRDLIVP